MSRGRRGALNLSAARRRMILMRVHKRDGGICWLCRFPVDINRRDGSDMAPSLDHYIPVSEGGGNEMRNLRLAHRVCDNQRQRGGGHP